MNIFFTNSDPVKCAREHNSVHLNKQLTEYAQLLSTVHRELTSRESVTVYKYVDYKGDFKKLSKTISIDLLPTEAYTYHSTGELILRCMRSSHEDGRFVKWLAKSSQHYQWLLDCWLEMHKMYFNWKGKYHATLDCYDQLQHVPVGLQDNGWYTPAIHNMTPRVECFYHACGIERAYQIAVKDKIREWESRQDRPIHVQWYQNEVPIWMNM